MPIKSISIPDDVKEFLDSLPNASRFITDLVREVMYGEGRLTKSDVEDVVRKVIQEVGYGRVRLRLGDSFERSERG